MRTGIGYDLHRLSPAPEGGQIWLGGVSIPCPFHLEAHSDGDVLLHALVDACLGALALGDIGTWFPDTAAENEGRPSRDFVATAMSQLAIRGWRVKQIDSNVFLEEPKLKPHRQAIRESLAGMLGIDLSFVSLKAKTMEGLGPIGERKAIAAQVVVLLEEG